MHKLPHLHAIYPRYWRALLVLGSATFVFLLLALFALRLPGDAWLPDAAQYPDNNSALFNLPIKRDTLFTRYGRAVRYQSAKEWVLHRSEPIGPFTTIYAFQANPLLRASDCPNITRIEPHDPSGCTTKATLRGQPIHTIHRRFASTTDESYVQIGNTFLYIVHTDRPDSYFGTLKRMSTRTVDIYLATNATRMNAINTQVRAEKALQAKKSAAAYTKLNFRPAVPGALPTGWTLNTKNPAPHMTLDGPDADHPSLVNMSYRNGQQSVRMHVGRLSDFALGPTCGPTPGHSMGYVACRRVGRYYQSVFLTRYQDYVRYMYYPVGDSLVFTAIQVPAKDGQAPAHPTQLIAAQTALTLAARPVDKNTFRGVPFDQMYYQRVVR
jgi:hypothetical protein